MNTEITSNANAVMSVKLSPEIIAAQGQNDREYLTHRMNLLLDAREKHPDIPIGDLRAVLGPEELPTMTGGMGSYCCSGCNCFGPATNNSAE